MARQKSPFILVPLYIYPTPTSWEPLFSAAKSNPDLEFFIVVNPGNGPGPGPLPDANYLNALARLSTLSNAKVFGYVHCSYGKRAASSIEKDILTYQGWNTQDEATATHIHGIFFDEVPSNTVYVQYMTNLSRAVKQDIQPLGHEAGFDAIVIFNPGVVIDPAFYQPADFVVAFENLASQWDSSAVRTGIAALPPLLREKSIAVAHGSTSSDEASRLTEKVNRAGFAGQFVTTQPGYTAWCDGWDAYVQNVRRLTEH